MVRETISLAFFRAFTPDVVDRTVPLARRLAGRPALAVTFLDSSIEACVLTFTDEGLPSFSKHERLDLIESDSEATFLRTFSTRHGLTEAVVNLQTGFTTGVTNRAKFPKSRGEALELMRSAPATILGEPEPQNQRHALTPHPTHNFALRVDFKKADLDKIGHIMTKANLTVVSFHCGMVDLVNYIIAKHWDEVTHETAFVFVDRQSVFTCLLDVRALGSPGFSMQLAAQDLRSEVNSRLEEALRPGRRVILVNDSQLDVEAIIRARGNSVVVPLQGIQDPELFAVCLDPHPTYAYDLLTTEQIPKPYAPSSYRLVPIFFWFCILTAAACISFNSLRRYRARAELANFDKARTSILEELGEVGKKTKELNKRQEVAERLREWIAISPSTQAFWVQVNQALSGPVVVQNMSMHRIQGQPQLRLVITVSATESAANEVFNRVSALLGKQGFKTVDFKTYSVPGGFQYNHLLNAPSS